jgi:hypothetical protein
MRATEMSRAINDAGKSPAEAAPAQSFSFNNFLYLQLNYAVLWNNGKPTDLGSLGAALATSP